MRLVSRCFAICSSLSLLVACGGGGGGGIPVPPPLSVGKPPPAQTTPATSSALSITGVDTNSPMALTPVHLRTTGVDPGKPVTVSFSDGSGFISTQSAIRVAADGTVAAAVPKYIDSTSGATGSGHLALTISQGGSSSAPVAMDVADIPQLADYGLPLGQISRSFYNYEILSLGRQLGGLQALAMSRSNHVDTTQAQSDTQALLTGMIKGRNDIDRIMTNNALAIPVGSVKGTTVNFDQNSLAMEDRVIGWYLLTLASTNGTVSGTLDKWRTPIVYSSPVRWTVASHRAAAGLARAMTSTSIAAKRVRVFAINPAQVKSILNGITGVGGAIKSTIDFQDSIANDPLSTKFDTILAVAGAVVGGAAAVAFFAPVMATSVGVTAVGAATAGLCVGTVAIYNDIYHEAVDLSIIENQATNGSSASLVAKAQADLDARPLTAAVDLVGALVSAAGTTASAAGNVGQALFGQLVNESSNIPEAAALVATVVGLAQSGQAGIDAKTTQSGADEIGAAFTTSSPDLFGVVQGSVSIQNSNGNSALTGLTGVELNQGAGQPIDASSMADGTGAYELIVPSNNPAIPYGSLSLLGYDPVLNTGVTASQTPDLSTLPSSSQTTPLSVPPLSGNCSDTDAGNPDGDDPDCD